MVPRSITRYLESHDVAFRTRRHPRAVTAQELAHALHVTGERVAKSVIIDVDGERWIAVLPATEVLDTLRVSEALGVHTVLLVDEEEFEDAFPDCELGAEPPFGRLYGMRVIADTNLAAQGLVWFRAGSHEEALEMIWEDFVDLERPVIAPIGQRREWLEPGRLREFCVQQ